MSASERILDTLLLFAAAEQPLTAVEVARRMGVPLSSAYRHLNLLKRYDFIMETGRDAGLTLGTACLRIGNQVNRDLVIGPVAIPEMRDLAQRTGESVGLMRAMGTEVLCVEMIESPQSLRCSFAKGRSTPMAAGASALGLLAFLPADQRAAILAHVAGEAGRTALEARLDRVRALGHAESEGEVDAGIWGVSAPIFSAPGRLEGSVTLMAPAVRVGPRRPELIAALTAATDRITARLSTPTTPDRDHPAA